VSDAATTLINRAPIRKRALARKAGQRGQALLRGACADGQSPRFGGQYPPDSDQRHRRTRGGPRDGGRESRARVGSPWAPTRVTIKRNCARIAGAQRHSARRAKLHSAIDRRSTRHPGYLLSQRRRKRVEEIFGWMKTIAGLHKTRHRGADRVGWVFTFAAAAYNLVRMRNLLPIAT